MAFIKECSIDSRNEQSPTSEVVHETNKAHFRNFLLNRFLHSSVGRALEWWSRGCGFQPHWGKFLMKFILFGVTLDLSDYLTETRIVKNSIVSRLERSEVKSDSNYFWQVYLHQVKRTYYWLQWVPLLTNNFKFHNFLKLISPMYFHWNKSNKKTCFLEAVKHKIYPNLEVTDDGVHALLGLNIFNNRDIWL